MLKSIVRKASFAEKRWHVFFNPSFITRRALIKNIKGFIKKIDFNENDTWIDVGCGSAPYRPLFNIKRYIGLDIKDGNCLNPDKKCDIVYDGKKLPFEDNSADGIICTQVLEHVDNIEGFILEIRRVLRSGGNLILTAPFCWQEHEKPYDFYRFTSFGAKDILERSGFSVKECVKTTGSIETIAQLMSAYISSNCVIKFPGFFTFIMLFICAPIQIMGITLQRILPDKKELFLDNAILAYKSNTAC